MKSYLHGRSQVHGGSLQAKGSRTTTPAEPARADCSPNVDVVKQGDKVLRIVITCTCGERVEVECLYPPGATA